MRRLSIEVSIKLDQALELLSKIIQLFVVKSNKKTVT